VVEDHESRARGALVEGPDVLAHADVCSLCVVPIP
jgi:hypothetical protein